MTNEEIRQLKAWCGEEDAVSRHFSKKPRSPRKPRKKKNKRKGGAS
jgi:hypothetical protein